MLADANNTNVNTRHDDDRVNLAGTIVELGFIVAASILFNMFPDKVGFVRSLAEPDSFTPLLAPEFQVHLPLLNLCWGLGFSLGLANLFTQRWTLVTRSIQVALDTLGIVVLIELVLGGPLTIYGWLDLALKFGLAVAIIPAIIDAFRNLAHLLDGQENGVCRPG